MKFREGNYALYCDDVEREELCTIVRCDGELCEIRSEATGEHHIAKMLKPITICSEFLQKIGYKYEYRMGIKEVYGTNATHDVCFYNRSDGSWAYSRRDVECCIPVRYIHEVQNLMDVLNDL